MDGKLRARRKIIFDILGFCIQQKICKRTLNKDGSRKKKSRKEGMKNKTAITKSKGMEEKKTNARKGKSEEKCN